MFHFKIIDMKIKSNLRLKTEDLVDAFYDLLDALYEFIAAILAHPPVKRVLEKILYIYWGVGLIGFAFIMIAGVGFFVSGFKSAEGSVTDWLRDFSVACPWLAFVWLVVVITTCLMLIHEGKKQNNQTNQTEAKAQ